jgi:type I restriction enzyme S subunit
LNEITKLAGYEFTKLMRYEENGDIIALRALNIKNERLDLSNIQRISRKTSDSLPRSKVNKNDVLITYIGAYIGDIVLVGESERFHLAPNIAKITAGEDILPRFLELVLRTASVRKQMMAFTVVTATPSLTMTQIRIIKIGVPSDLEEQARIISIITTLKARMESECVNRDKYTNLKSGLMQDLLTGKVRVKVDA